MHFLKLHFRGRSESFSIPVTESELRSFTEQLTFQDASVGIIRIHSAYGQFVMINSDRLQFARHLLEMNPPEFDPSEILPSPIDEDDLSGASDDDHNVDLLFWFSWSSDYLLLDTVPGSNATKLHLADNSGHCFVTITDEDDEDVTVQLSECDLIVETEQARYPAARIKLVR
jgi:hypothetical protein